MTRDNLFFLANIVLLAVGVFGGYVIGRMEGAALCAPF